jgi:16S rRNA processing protein RimM
MEKEKVLVGKIGKPFGLKGEARIECYTDFPDERFGVGNELFMREKGKDKAVIVATHRFHKGDLVSFENMQDINIIEQYRGLELYAYKDDELLEEGEVWVSDLIGCEVYNYGKMIGKVEDFYDNTAQGLLLVIVKGKRVMIPYVDAFVKKVDLDNKRIDVELIKGFIDDED